MRSRWRIYTHTQRSYLGEFCDADKDVRGDLTTRKHPTLFRCVQLFKHVYRVTLNAPAVTVVVERVARAHAAVVAIVDMPVAAHRYFANAFVAVSAI